MKDVIDRPDLELETVRAPAGMSKKDKDPLGRTVRRVYVDTEEFVIYCADYEEDVEDVCTLSYLFKPSIPNDKAKSMRAGLCPIAAQIARLSDNLSGMSMRLDSLQQRRQRDRAFELMARAMAFGFEGQKDQAKKILDALEQDIALRRDSKNRMRYRAAQVHADRRPAPRPTRKEAPATCRRGQSEE